MALNFWGTPRLRLILVTGVSVAEAKGKEHGKLSREYKDGVALCEMDERDMKALGVEPGQNVRVTSKYGSIVVKVSKMKEPNPGIIFIPTGAWANQLIGAETYCSGMPDFKGVEVEVEAAPTEPVLDLRDLLKATYGRG
ncbi:MAG: molybdopterin dinucleotide binding domain-containing protein [Candidatus Bathyarchaeia archaeon]